MQDLNHTTFGDPSNPAVLLLHGFMGSSADWLAVTEALTPDYYCIAVDLPGHGASTRLSPEAYTTEGTAEALLGLLDRLRVERSTVVGYSMGGRLALYLALRRPANLCGVFLESASPGLESSQERAARRAADEKKAVRLEGGGFASFVRDWYGQPLFAPLARDEGLLRRTIEGKLGNNPAELAKSLRGMGTGSQPSVWEELPGLRVPALAVAGELDEKFVGISRRMESLAPALRAVVVPDVGHNVHAEATGPYLSSLKNFLSAGHAI